MNANNTKVKTLIESTFLTVLDKLKSEESVLVSDLFVQIDRENGELAIYEEGETLIEKNVIFDWAENTQDEAAFKSNIIPMVKAALASLTSQNVFEYSCFVKPFSISLTDEEFTVIEELLFIDDDMLRLDDPLLKDLDNDLDDFLEKLLSDVE